MVTKPGPVLILRFRAYEGAAVSTSRRRGRAACGIASTGILTEEAIGNALEAGSRPSRARTGREQREDRHGPERERRRCEDQGEIVREILRVERVTLPRIPHNTPPNGPHPILTPLPAREPPTRTAPTPTQQPASPPRTRGFKPGSRRTWARWCSEGLGETTLSQPPLHTASMCTVHHCLPETQPLTPQKTL